MTRWGGLVAAAASAVVLAGCGTESEGESAPALPAFGPPVSAAPGTSAPVTDAAVLGARLLSERDLPGMEQIPEAAGAATVGVASADPAACARVLQPLGRQRPDALTRAAVAFDGPDFSSIDIDAATYRDDALAAAFADFQRLPRDCARYTGTDADGVAIDYRVGALDQAPAGDASTAYQLRLTSEGLTLVSLVSLVQVGNTVAQISVTAPESVDPGILADVTAAQVRALRAA